MIESKEWICDAYGGPACWGYDGLGSCRCKPDNEEVAEEETETKVVSSTNQSRHSRHPEIAQARM